MELNRLTTAGDALPQGGRGVGLVPWPALVFARPPATRAAALAGARPCWSGHTPACWRAIFLFSRGYGSGVRDPARPAATRRDMGAGRSRQVPRGGCRCALTAPIGCYLIRLHF